ncbi:hypothetical protein DMB95_00420 [Campylobacter sp. MIT 12-8780]|uniref:acyl-CoA dehydrogenase family protein n=1 Tax=unclassified Campylobacter TaxID=2593542 RepID=UPI00115D5276|nr:MULTISPECIES: acyl-CoA dehydrogenase family protein [unclassified Campylobacter]NDJ26424.1 acyl-CoA/acyl-ACP dehydrogenase [Campylobacter sp. MIT 19-121]TQR42999.1 hypothetical protein DMB95_00420 [Campylobacter sp. MIT 12-8780]
MQNLAKELLSKKAQVIHQGYYPKEELKALAKAGAFKPFEKGISGLFEVCKNIKIISSHCGNTGFLAWCHAALIYYLLHSPNKSLQDSFLQGLINGEILGGTGLSNAAKAQAKLEKNFLKAKSHENGFIINGKLPWVSNLDDDALFAVLFESENGSKVGLIKASEIKTSQHIRFIALEGSATKSIGFKDYFLPQSRLIAEDGEAFFTSIITGFILLQCALGLGLLYNCYELIKDKNYQALPYNAQKLQNEIHKFEQKLEKLCKDPHPKTPKKALKLKLNIAKTCQKASSWVVIYNGTKGFLQGSSTSKLLLEICFFALVSPSVKHLYKLLQKD